MDEVIDLADKLIARLSSLPLAQRQAEKPALWERAQALRAFAKAANRNMNAEESQRYDALTGAIEEISQAELEEKRHTELERKLSEPRRDARLLPGGNPENENRTPQDSAQYRAALNGWLRHGIGELEPAQRQLLRNGIPALATDEQRAATRAMGTTSGPVGGYLVPSTFNAQVIETMKSFSPLNAIVDVVETDAGEALQWPTNDDTANTGLEVAESADVGAATDLSFGMVTLNAFLYSSKIFKVPFTLLQDSSIDLEAFIGRKAGERLGRIFALREASGDGVNKIQGLTVGLSSGKTAASASAITYNELIDLEHSPDPAYRGPGRASYLFNDGTLKVLRQLQDGSQRPLWIPWLGSGVAGAVPATFNGHNYTIAQDMPAIGASTTPIAFGDFKAAYKLRLVRGMSLIRIEERYIELGQVGFLMFARADGRVVDTAAAKLLTMHA